MPRIYFNWKLAFVLIISVVVVGATAFGLRKWQRSNRAVRSLKLGIKAYDAQNWNDAAKHLGTYVAVEMDDVPILLKYCPSRSSTEGPVNHPTFNKPLALIELS